jgi:hypothetical protein
LLIVGTGAAMSVPAGAALKDCPNNYTCIWNNNDFTGSRAHRAQGQGDYLNVPAANNNEMDSWANRSASYISCGKHGENGTGAGQTWNRVSNDNNVAPWNSDQVSSWRTRYGC